MKTELIKTINGTAKQLFYILSAFTVVLTLLLICRTTHGNILDVPFFYANAIAGIAYVITSKKLLNRFAQ